MKFAELTRKVDNKKTLIAIDSIKQITECRDYTNISIENGECFSVSETYSEVRALVWGEID
jgi:hypothetical protein